MFRGSKSRNKVSVGEPAEGSSTKSKYLFFPYPSVHCFFFLSFLNVYFPFPEKGGGNFFEEIQIFLPKKNTPMFMLSKNCFYYKKKKLFETTFNNGSLGSRNDEERSEMRYVM